MTPLSIITDTNTGINMINTEIDTPTTSRRAWTVCLANASLRVDSSSACVCATVLEQPHPGRGSQVQRRLLVPVPRNLQFGLLHAERQRLSGLLRSRRVAGDPGTCAGVRREVPVRGAAAASSIFAAATVAAFTLAASQPRAGECVIKVRRRTALPSTNDFANDSLRKISQRLEKKSLDGAGSCCTLL